jgi:hypothetical protein
LSWPVRRRLWPRFRPRVRHATRGPVPARRLALRGDASPAPARLAHGSTRKPDGPARVETRSGGKRWGSSCARRSFARAGRGPPCRTPRGTTRWAPLRQGDHVVLRHSQVRRVYTPCVAVIRAFTRDPCRMRVSHARRGCFGLRLRSGLTHAAREPFPARTRAPRWSVAICVLPSGRLHHVPYGPIIPGVPEEGGAERGSLRALGRLRGSSSRRAT